MQFDDDIKEFNVNLHNGSSVIQMVDVNNIRLLTPQQVIEIIPVSVDDLEESRKTGTLFGYRAPLFTYFNANAYYSSIVISEWLMNLPQAHKLNGKTLTKYRHGNSGDFFDWDLV